MNISRKEKFNEVENLGVKLSYLEKLIKIWLINMNLIILKSLINRRQVKNVLE